jgi:hypothetical protein
VTNSPMAKPILIAGGGQAADAAARDENRLCHW